MNERKNAATPSEATGDVKAGDALNDDDLASVSGGTMKPVPPPPKPVPVPPVQITNVVGKKGASDDWTS